MIRPICKKNSRQQKQQQQHEDLLSTSPVRYLTSYGRCPSVYAHVAAPFQPREGWPYP